MFALLILLSIAGTQAFSVPGLSTQVFSHGESVQLYMNELDSTSNQVPYDPYFLKFCRPHKVVKDNFQNLGSLLLGEKTVNSPYKVYVGLQMQCQYLCEVQLTQLDVNDFQWFIQHNYRINMEIDNLPVIQNTTTTTPLPGYAVGYTEEGGYFINNHVHLVVHYHPINDKEYRIVGFTAQPKSLANYPKMHFDATTNGSTMRNVPSCADSDDYLDVELYSLPQEIKAGSTVVFSYDVEFIENLNKTHGSRWDQYITTSSQGVQWVSLGVSFMTAILLTGIVALLLRLALRRDLLKYRMVADLPQANEFNDQGWKQLSRDVFRPPTNPLLFAVFVGTGMQLVSLICCTLFLACLGFVYQAHRGNIITMIIVVFVFTGSVNGYNTARYYKYFQGSYWLLCTLVGNLAFPLITLLIQWLIHIFLSIEDSSSSVTFKTAITFLALWLGIQVPLNLVGAFIGFKLDTQKNPSKAYPLAQPVPPQPWYLEEFYACAIGGLVCFASVGVEFSFIMQLMWSHAFQQFFISLFLSVLLLFVISGEIAIIVTYLSLVRFYIHHIIFRGNHVWWWKAFLVPFSAGIYLFIYSFQYYMAELTFTRLSAIIFYFGTMFLISLIFGLVCGTVGFISSYKFVRTIYGLIKHD